MRKLLKVLVWIVAGLVILALGATAVARVIAGRKYNTHWTTHEASFPVPFPLTATELETLRAERLAAGAPAADPLAGVDLQAAARARAVARGEHLVKTRVGCNGCHGPDMGGKALIDQKLVGYWAAPNLTTGVANITPHETGLKGWTEADFIRALREGKRKDGSEILPQMPWKAYGQMSDIELKALWAYLQTVPAVEKGNR